MSLISDLEVTVRAPEVKTEDLPYFSVKEYPDPALRRPCQPYIDPVVGNGMLQQLCAIMEKTLEGYRAAGLAGPQVGIFYRIIVVRVDGKPLTMINPAIVERAATVATETEGCLSFPGLDVRVERATQVAADFVDRDGKHCRRWFTGIEARAVQHEIDHLDGKTFLDRIPKFHRAGALEKMKINQRRNKSAEKKLKAVLAQMKAAQKPKEGSREEVDGNGIPLSGGLPEQPVGVSRSDSQGVQGQDGRRIATGSRGRARRRTGP